MPKMVEVIDKETGKRITMTAVDAKEAMDNDPERYGARGSRASSSEPAAPRKKPGRKPGAKKTTSKPGAKPQTDASEETTDDGEA